MKGVRWVRNQKDGACVIAALAMITGLPFKKVLEDFRPLWEMNGSEEGLSFDAAYQYLAHLGYATQVIHYEYEPKDKLIYPWPVKPFAPLHLCCVNAGSIHAVVMLENGIVLDPDDKQRKEWTLDAYHRVYHIAGVWKVNSGLIPT